MAFYSGEGALYYYDWLDTVKLTQWRVYWPNAKYAVIHIRVITTKDRKLAFEKLIIKRATTSRGNFRVITDTGSIYFDTDELTDVKYSWKDKWNIHLLPGRENHEDLKIDWYYWKKPVVGIVRQDRFCDIIID